MLSHRFQPSHLQKLCTASAWHFSTLTPDTFPLQAQESRRKHSHRESSEAFKLIAHPWKSPLNRLAQRNAIMRIFVFSSEEYQGFVAWGVRKGNCQIQALVIAASKGQGEKCSEAMDLTKTQESSLPLLDRMQQWSKVLVLRRKGG